MHRMQDTTVQCRVQPELKVVGHRVGLGFRVWGLGHRVDFVGCGPHISNLTLRARAFGRLRLCDSGDRACLFLKTRTLGPTPNPEP